MVVPAVMGPGAVRAQDSRHVAAAHGSRRALVSGPRLSLPGRRAGGEGVPEGGVS